VLDAAERIETPLSPFVLCRPSQLAFGAQAAFAGTRCADAIVARARELDERWKVGVAAVMKARQELCDKLAGEAERAWAPLRDATDAVAFDAETAQPGTVVRLDRVYNRCGWDYTGRGWDFAIRTQGIVLGGVYAPHVLKAIEHACYELKLNVSDRLPWDLVGVVEGPAKIGMRTTTILREKGSGFELGRLEEWPPIDCLQIRIIALRAGPVAVGAGT
jgi:hypothetical protein